MAPETKIVAHGRRRAHIVRLLPVAAITVAVILAADRPPALAQVSPPQPPPVPGDPLRTIPEKVEPKSAPEAKAPKGSLSDKLGQRDGVIAPPKGVDPKMDVQPPNPNPGSMPVIPPPGSPGNPSPVVPK